MIGVIGVIISLNPTDHAGLQRLVRDLDCADSGVDRVRIRNL